MPEPAKVGARHYSVEFENDQILVRRIHYGPGVKSIMHGHPVTIGTSLSDARVKMTFPMASQKQCV